MVIRLNEKNEPFEVDERGSDYLDRLHRIIREAKRLAEDVQALNSECLSLGAGRMARLKELAGHVLVK